MNYLILHLQAKLLEASQITQNWMQAAAAAAAAAAVNNPQGMAATSGPPQTPPAMSVAPSVNGSPPGQALAGCNTSNPNILGKGKSFLSLFFGHG